MTSEMMYDVLDTTIERIHDDCLDLDISLISDTCKDCNSDSRFELDISLIHQSSDTCEASNNDSRFELDISLIHQSSDTCTDLHLTLEACPGDCDSVNDLTGDFDCMDTISCIDFADVFNEDTSIHMNTAPVVLPPKVNYSNIDLSGISKKRWTVYNYLWNIVSNQSERNHFIFLCEKYIPLNEDTTHYNFWNLAASCLYCVCLKASIPVVLEEIIESDQRITRNRMTKIGKTIRITEKVPNSVPFPMASRMVCRMAMTEYRTSRGQTISENVIHENLLRINEDKNMIGVSLYHRLILIYSLFVPTIKGNAIYSDDISKACIFFRQPCTMWLLKMCQAFQEKNNKKI